MLSKQFGAQWPSSEISCLTGCRFSSWQGDRFITLIGKANDLGGGVVRGTAALINSPREAPHRLCSPTINLAKCLHRVVIWVLLPRKQELSKRPMDGRTGCRREGIYCAGGRAPILTASGDQVNFGRLVAQNGNNRGTTAHLSRGQNQAFPAATLSKPPGTNTLLT